MTRRQYNRFRAAYGTHGGWCGPATLQIAYRIGDKLVELGVNAPAAGKLVEQIMRVNRGTVEAVELALTD